MKNSIDQTILGRTGFDVTRLGYGAGHRKPMDDTQRNMILRSVLDSGINFIDTADDYGNSEELIGRYISNRKEEYYLATKCCGSSAGHIWTVENAFDTLHQSLRRLKTDCIDLMQLHNPTVEECRNGDLVIALQEMQKQGKVKYIGISTSLPDLSEYLDWNVFDTFQLDYSAMRRENEKWIKKVSDLGAGIIIRGGVALGEPGSGLGEPDIWMNFDKAGLDDLREHGESRTAFMLRFTISHVDVDTAIVGTTNPNHLLENVEAALKGPLTPDVYNEVKRRTKEVGIEVL